jgi:hypothetical protein
LCILAFYGDGVMATVSSTISGPTSSSDAAMKRLPRGQPQRIGKTALFIPLRDKILRDKCDVVVDLHLEDNRACDTRSELTPLG